MRAFLSNQEMMRADSELMRRKNISSYELMNSVALDCAHFLEREFSSASFVFLCGPGNNGGDAYCTAEILTKRGQRCEVVQVFPPKSKDCLQAAQNCSANLKKLEEAKGEVWIDGIFGIQGRDEVSGNFLKVLNLVNKKNVKRVALDVPSGIDLEKSRAHPSSFKADISLVVGYPKLNFLNPQIGEFLGRIEFVGKIFDLNLEGNLQAIEWQDSPIPYKKRTSHKSVQGRVAVIGGSAHMPGAAFMAAEAASRVGAGYVSLYFAKPSKSFRLRPQEASFLFRQNWKVSELKNQSALIFGCGGKAKIDYSKIQQPSVIDASALSGATKSEISSWKKSKAHFVLTPHPGEAAYLLGSSLKSVLTKPDEALRALRNLTGQSIVLKTQPSRLIFSRPVCDSFKLSENKSYVNLVFNPSFACAGSGDIFSGILGGLLASSKLEFPTQIFQALLMQRACGEFLRDRMNMASDFLKIFSEAREFWSRQLED